MGLWGSMRMPSGTPGAPMDGGGSFGGPFGGHAFHGGFGAPHPQAGGPRTSLMEVFNRVSTAAAGGVMQSLLPGMMDMSRAFMKDGSGASAKEVSSTLGAGQSHYEAGILKGGAAAGPGDAGQDHGKVLRAPGDATSERDPSVRESGGTAKGAHPGSQGGDNLPRVPPRGFPGGGVGRRRRLSWRLSRRRRRRSWRGWWLPGSSRWR